MLYAALLVCWLLQVNFTHANDIEEPDPFYEYAKCTDKKVTLYKLNNGRPYPKAIVVPQGDRVEMKCSLCYRPDKDWSEMHIVWYRLRTELKESEEVPIGKLNYALTGYNSLVIESVGEQHSAHYICLYRGLARSSYYLEVSQPETKQLVLAQGKGRRPAANKVMDHKNLYVFTAWSDWSQCSACDKVGFRRRTGICTVSKLRKGPSKPDDVHFLNVFVDGLPCRSVGLKDLSRKIPEISQRKSEILIDFCYMVCPTEPPLINVTDEFGNVVEQLMGPNEVSINEPAPPIPPMVHRETHYLAPKAKINFTCPRDKLHQEKLHVQVRWENGSRPINPISISRATRGRVYIDGSNRLNFKKVKPSDTGYYSCWQEGWLVATFRIICEKRSLAFELIPSYTFYIGGFLAIIIMTCVVLKMWKGREDKRGR